MLPVLTHYAPGVDLRLTPAELDFRDQVREFLARTVPGLGTEPPETDMLARREFDTAWQRTLYDNGYAGINWPREYGGLGASPTEQLIFLEEAQRAGAPQANTNFVGLQHAGPTLIVEATEAQKSYHLPAILKGEHIWCQGFSEPNAGSDLASLSTRAERDGD